MTSSVAVLRAQTASAEDIDRLRALVDMGAMPRAALEKAQARVEDRNDEEILQRTLYGMVRVEETTEQQCAKMIESAQRRVQRTEARVNELRPLVEQGIMAKAELAPYLEDLESRRRTLSLAESRARLLHELAELARTEQSLDLAADYPASARSWEKFDGRSALTPSLLRKVSAAYQSRFGQPLPVSANGESAFHKALGYDHRGRVDVALTPDQPEGVWLRQFLEREQVSYFAFRNAINGSATGAHIHIGAPSLRLRVAD